MTKVLRFGSYVFPETQAGFSDNFKNAVTKTTRLAGTSGAFNEYGSYPEPTEGGTVQFNFTLVEYTIGNMQAKRDAINALRWKGQQPLFVQPGNSYAARRFCMAKLSNINMPQRLDRHTDVFQPVTLNFTVEDPRWLAYPNASYVGDEAIVGSGTTVAADRVAMGVVPGTQYTLPTNNGNTETPVFLRILRVGSNASTITLKHYAPDMTLLQYWIWDGGLTVSGDELWVDSHDASVWKVSNGVMSPAFANFRSFVGDGFLLLYPGANRIELGGSGWTSLNIRMSYYDAWKGF